MIEAVEFFCFFEGNDIKGVFDDADQALVPFFIGADNAQFFFGDIETIFAKPDIIFQRFYAFAKIIELRSVLFPQIQNQPFGKLWSD
jgi:hypothetical protein